MLNNILFLITTLLALSNSATSDDSDENKLIHDKNVSELKYAFNHPPSAEDINPEAVRSAYDGSSDISTQSEATISDERNSDTVLKNRLINENTSKLPETTKVENDRTYNKQTAKSDLSELQIPVQVIYEDDPSTIKPNIRTKTETVKQRSRRGPIRKRKYENKVNSDVPKKRVPNEILSAQSVTETPHSNVAARSFSKRVGGRDPIVPIIDSESYVFSHSGNFHYRYQGGDGTKAYSEGKLTKVDETNKGHRGEAVRGGYSYTDKDGNDFSLSYTADERGYMPVGAHLPTPPPIPPAIARALAYLATATTPEPVTKRSTKLV